MGMVEDKEPVVMVVCTLLDGMAVHAVDRVGCARTVSGVGGACRKMSCSVVCPVGGVGVSCTNWRVQWFALSKRSAVRAHSAG